MNKKEIFNKIVKDIKSIKIQGARNIAKKAVYAYSLFPTEKSKKILMHLRPTEPTLFNSLNQIKDKNYSKIFSHFDDAQDKINKNVGKIINKDDKIFTHCHSTNVVNFLIYSKKHGRNFEVYNTETRPLFQGRKTAKELRKSKIKVTLFVDSAIATAIEKDNGNDKIFVNKIFLGADAITEKGIINKVGSKAIAELAKIHKIPVYIIADSWKYSPKQLKIEERNIHEIWEKIPSHIKVKNPAFEFVDKKYITKIISEYGILSFNDFLKKVKI